MARGRSGLQKATSAKHTTGVFLGVEGRVTWPWSKPFGAGSHFGWLNSQPILEPILVGIGMFSGTGE